MTTIQQQAQKSKPFFGNFYKREVALLRAKKIMRLALIALGAALGLWVGVRFVLPLFFPVLFGLAVAALVERPARALRKKTGLPQGAAAFFCVLGLYALAGAAGFFLCRLLCSELTAFARQLPAMAARLASPLAALKKTLFSIAARFPDGIGSGLRAGLESFFASGAALGSRVYEALFRFASGFLGRLPDLFLALVSAVLASFMLAGQLGQLRLWCAARIPAAAQAKLRRLAGHLKTTLGAWVKAQLQLMSVTFFILTAGFLLLRLQYALLFSLLITLIDALPLFGTGTVLIPWSMAQFLQGNSRCGVGLLLLYAASALVRQALEPRLLGGQLGLPPVVTLAALYAGWRVMGVAGMVLFPLLAVFCLQIYRSLPPAGSAPPAGE